MKQMSLDAPGFERKTMSTRKHEFVNELNLVVLWSELVALIAPPAPVHSTKSGCPPFAVATMLHIHFLQQWFKPPDPSMEDALYNTPMFQGFAALDMGENHLSDESTILRFLHSPEANNLTVQIPDTAIPTLTAKGLSFKQDPVFDPTLIAVPNSTRNQDGQRAPEIHQSKKGNQTYFGMKVQAQHPNLKSDTALIPGNREALDKDAPIGAILEKRPEKTTASVRVNVKHPFRVIKRQCGYTKIKRQAAQEQSQSGDAVCAIEPVQDAQTTLECGGSGGMSDPEMGRMPMNVATFAPKLPLERPGMPSSETSTRNDLFRGGYADLP